MTEVTGDVTKNKFRVSDENGNGGNTAAGGDGERRPGGLPELPQGVHETLRARGGVAHCKSSNSPVRVVRVVKTRYSVVLIYMHPGEHFSV